MKQLINMVIVLLPMVCGAVTVADFPCSREIRCEKMPEIETAVFLFDDRLYAQVDDDFGNMRLFNSKEEEVPFLVRIAKIDTILTQVIPVVMTRLSFSPATEGMEIVFTRGRDDSIPDELNVVTSLINFENKVKVEGSNDRKKWRILADDYPIYDYSQYTAMRMVTVPFKKRRYDYYRVTIARVTQMKKSVFSKIVNETGRGGDSRKSEAFIAMQEPFRIDRITFTGSVRKRIRSKVREVPYATEFSRIVDDTENKRTLLYLRTQREPIASFSIVTNDMNFTRRVTVAATDNADDSTAWKHLCGGEILDISLGTFSKKQTEIPLHGTYRHTMYRIAIQNNDNTPLKISKVSAHGSVHEAVFFHRGETTLKCCFGGDTIPAPHYDISNVLRKAPVVSETVWQSGAVVCREKAGEKRLPISPKLLLIVVMGVMVVVLVSVLVTTLKKVENTGNVQPEKKENVPPSEE